MTTEGILIDPKEGCCMTNKWREKNVGVSLRRGKTNKKPVLDDRDGTVGGYEIEHWDDHQDAVVMPKSVRASFKVDQPS